MSDPRQPSDQFRQRIAASRARFLESFAARIAEPRALVAAKPSGRGSGDGEAPSRVLHRLIHDICGSAGMLGLHDIDREGRTALSIVEMADLETRALSPAEQAEVSGILDRLAALAANHRSNEGL